MSVELVTRIGELIPDPQCVYIALRDILPHCTAPSNTFQRSQLAVQLTVCDYKAASLDYPTICTNKNQLQECMHQLESRAQWWTSYTTNHQTIGTICVEYQPEFEAQVASQLYRNLSSITQSYLQDLDDAYKELKIVENQSNMLSTMEKALMNMKLQMEELTSEVALSGQNTRDLSVGLDTLGEQNAQLQALNGQLVQDMVQTSLSLSQYNKDISFQFQSLTANLTAIAVLSSQVQQVQNLTLQSALNASEIARETVQELKEHTGAILGIIESLKIFSRIIAKMWWCVAIIPVFVIIWKVAANTSSPHTTTSQKSSQTKKPNLLYY